MEKTIKIGKQNVRLSNNVGWTMEYRDQFGQDIVPIIMPALASIMDVVTGIFNATGKTKDIEISDLLKSIEGDTLTDVMIHLSGLEFVELINITWAMAKAADDDVPDPKTWVRQFDNFPIDVIAPQVFELVLKGMVSSKNWKRLTNLISQIKKSQPESTSTQSSSPESNED